jgi:DNA-binding MarR family transcriptional regulator
MQDYQFCVLMKLYLFGKKLQALVKKHNSDKLSQSIILRLVSHAPQSVSDIADVFSIKISAATSKIVEMEHEGLLIRSFVPDKRSHMVTITTEGKKMLNEMKEKFHKGSWFCLTKIQARTLTDLVDRIRLE